MQKLILLLLLPAVLLCSCEKKFHISLPAEQYKPVLNAFLSQDSVVCARVTLSGRPENLGAMLYPEPAVAEVQLYEDGVYKETLQTFTMYDKTYYVSQTRVQAGKQYRLTLKVPDYDLVEGSDIVPDRAHFSIADKNAYISIGSDGFEQQNLSFTVRHEGQAKGYYQYRVFSYQTTIAEINGNDTIWRMDKIQRYFDIKSNDGSIFGGGDGYINMTGNILSEKALEPGESGLVSLSSSDGYYGMADSFQVEVWQLNEATYKYLQSVKTALDTDGDPTAEKVLIYSNIRNGFGIIGGMTIRSEIIKP